MSGGQEQLEVSRLIKAPVDRVFAAWTDPSLIVQWWGAGGVRCTEAEMDLRVGGSYRIANQTPDGSTMWITGTFSRVERPERLTYTWAMEPVGPETTYSLVDVGFESTDEGTMVRIQHTRVPDLPTREVNLQGWIGCLDGLADLLSP